MITALIIALGFALQGSLGDLASGIMLIIFRPYKVGDYIEANGEEGIVEDLNVFITTLRTLDNVKLILANGDCLLSTIKNYTSLGKRRVDMDKAIKIITNTAKKHPQVISKPDTP